MCVKEVGAVSSKEIAISVFQIRPFSIEGLNNKIKYMSEADHRPKHSNIGTFPRNVFITFEFAPVLYGMIVKDSHVIHFIHSVL